jgi:hypothetical protein
VSNLFPSISSIKKRVASKGASAVRRISIKALVIANVVFFIIALIICCIGTVGALLVVWLWNGFPKNMDEIATGLQSSTLCISLLYALSLTLAAVGAGYFAARIARRNHTLNSALASGLCTLLNIWDLVPGPMTDDPGPEFPQSVRIAVLLAVPLCGILGGYLAGRPERNAAARLMMAGSVFE